MHDFITQNTDMEAKSMMKEIFMGRGDTQREYTRLESSCGGPHCTGRGFATALLEVEPTIFGNLH